MDLTAYLVYALALVCNAFLVFRVVARRDYLQRKQMGPLSFALESLIWGPFFAFPYVYSSPGAPTMGIPGYVGSALIALGIVAIVVFIGSLGFRRSCGQEVNVLRTSGVYSVTRNPQIVAGVLIIVGTVLRWPSWYHVGWVILYGVMAHLMVITEEEHLRDVFGEPYREYCRRVPRYVPHTWRNQ